MHNKRLLNNNQQPLTEDKMVENRRQRGLLGMKLSERKFPCEKKLADACEHFFHDYPKCGKTSTDAGGRHYIQIFTLNLELKSKIAGRSSDRAFHEFLNNCYERVVEIHKRRTAAAEAAVKSDQDFIKFRENILETVEKNIREKRVDQGLVQNGKIMKKMPAFNKEELSTWPSLSHEDAEASKIRLTEKKTKLLKKIKENELAISSLEMERKPFDEKINKRKTELGGDLSESEFKDVKLSLEFYELKIKKIQTKIEKNNEDKTAAQDGIDALDKEVSILECVLDAHQLQKDSKNFLDRKSRVIMRVEKALREREQLNTLRTNLNKRWAELTRSPEEKPRLPYITTKPVKEEELCAALCLKADAENYFI